MHRLLNLFKSLLIGGFLFLLPLGVLIVVFGKLLSLAQRFGGALHKWLFPGAQSEAAALAFAIFMLIVIALLAGAFARTGAGKRMFGWFEKAILSNLPIYTIYRQMIPETEIGTAETAEGKKTPIVAVHLDDQTLIGFLVDSLPDGQKVVYLPAAPSGLSGSVVIMDPERLEETGLKPTQLIRGLRRLGAGMSDMVAKTKE